MKNALIASLRGMGFAMAAILALSSSAAVAASVQLVEIKILTSSDWDGADEVWLETEITGDNQSDVIWGVNYMKPGDDRYNNYWLDGRAASTNNPSASVAPIACDNTYFCKAIAIWDQGATFDVEEQIGVLFINATLGTRTETVEGAGGKYQITYTVY
jgi:hypothetical protein